MGSCYTSKTSVTVIDHDSDDHSSPSPTSSSTSTPSPSPSLIFENVRQRPHTAPTSEKRQQYYMDNTCHRKPSRSPFIPHTQAIEVLDLAGFVNERIVESGSCSDIYSVVEVETNQLKAVKLMNIELSKADHAPDYESMMREIETMNALSKCQYVVTFFRSFQCDGIIGIVMEMAYGETMMEILNKAINLNCYLSLQDIGVVAWRIAAALEYIHQEGYVHRDVKLENILVMRKSESELCDFSSVKLCDFGLCRKVDPVIRALDIDIVGSSGTPQYVSPEVLSKEYPLTSACDIWSFGITLFAMLFNQELFTPDPYLCNEERHLDILQRVVMEPLESVLDVRRPKNIPEIDFHAGVLIDSMLSRDPFFRPTAFQCLDSKWLSNFAQSSNK